MMLVAHLVVRHDRVQVVDAQVLVALVADHARVFRAVRRMLPSEDVSRGLIGDLFREIDVDRSGDIDFDEFLLLVTELDSGNIDFREFADGRWA